ncbi:MAG: pyruvate-binding protein [Phycisphaerales bacterium]
MRQSLILLIAVVVSVLGGGRASAGPFLLDENFDNQHSGVGALNFSGFSSGWTVSQGSVDLIGKGFFDFLPGKGLYIDLDGSTKNAGVLASPEFALDPGTYRVNFSLAGNQKKSAADNVTVSFGDWSQTFHILASQPLTPHSFDIPVPTKRATRLTFSNAGGDNIGALLDDVQVFSIPTPAGAVALALLSASLAFRRGR